MSLAQTPPGLPLNKAIAQAGLACRGQPAGVSLLAKVRDAERRCPREERAWSTYGPHAIGAERFLAVSSGLQRYFVRAGHRCDPGETSPGAEP